MFKVGDRVAYNGKFDLEHSKNYGEWLGMDVVGCQGEVLDIRLDSEGNQEVLYIKLDSIEYSQIVNVESVTLVEDAE